MSGKRNTSLNESRHKKGSIRSLHSDLSNSRHMKGSKHIRTSQYDSDNDSFNSSESFHYEKYPAPKSTSSLPVSQPPPTAMFSNQSLKLIYLSWDVIKDMEDGKKQIGEKLFELLSDEEVPLAHWFDGTNSAHQASFVQMIDTVVSMLSPTDLDVVSKELVSLGKRHAHHNRELIQAFLPSLFQHFTEAFCKALKHCVHRHLFGGSEGRENLMKRSSSQHSLLFDDSEDLEGKRPSNWKMVEHAWQDLFWFIRCQMEEGAMMEYQRQKVMKHEQLFTEIEYDVELKSDTFEEVDEEVSLKGTKPWSFSSRNSSASTVDSSDSSITDDSADGTTPKSRKKKKRGLPERLRLLRLNSFSGSFRTSIPSELAKKEVNSSSRSLQAS